MMRIQRFVYLVIAMCCTVASTLAQSRLEQDLLFTSTDKLAQQAAESGDAARGALLFHSSTLGCALCHRVDDEEVNVIGPNLAKWKEPPTSTAIIESILRPSAKIDPKYASTRILTDDGQVFTGVVISKNEKLLQLRFGPKPEDRVEIETENIDRQALSELSLMPAGIVQQLKDRGQFLDLVTYVQAIAIGGPKRAAELMPKPELLQQKLPEYESHIDHAGLISSWNDESLARGEKIYKGLCINCHGTKEAAGSLPTALRFGQGKFKQGSDPYSLYRTLTHGSGLMLPQIWMVPQQKYDVIHFIREHFLKDSDVAPYRLVDADYLASLPTGNTRGPEPRVIQPWIDMDYGDTIATTIEFGTNGNNIAQKAIAFRLDAGNGGVSKGNVWMAFEHDTMRWAAGWKGPGFINWEGIQFNGSHGIHPRAVGEIEFENPTQPGWANPETGLYDDDARVVGRDKKRYGPLPKSWAQYLGMQQGTHGNYLEYAIDGSNVRERPFMVQTDDAQLYYGRVLSMDPIFRSQTLLVETFPGTITKVVSDLHQITVDWERASGEKERFLAMMSVASGEADWQVIGTRLSLVLKPNSKPSNLSLVVTRTEPEIESAEKASGFVASRLDAEIAAGFVPITPTDTREVAPHRLQTKAKVWYEGNGWAVDEIVPPFQNPWNARIRVTGLAFYPDQDAMAVCTWDGDIWKVTGLDQLDHPVASIQWERIASGLFQPLGILAYDDHLMVTCRDQLMKLRDTNDDGLIDDFECFNNDHQVTEHFHEFAMGLQQDGEGNFYYAKSARHALPAVVPHHGTLLKVTSDGSTTEIIANGFRAANGVCLNADGSFIVTDQEGHWNPKNRINWVTPATVAASKGKSGAEQANPSVKFYGNMFGYHSVKDSSDKAMEPPLCWITNSFDRSPAELLWVDSPKWGSLNKSLLNLSYGYGRIYVVPFETVDGTKQGGMCALPIPDLPTGIVRGRFSPRDGQLYVGGMFAWASSRQDQEGGLFRIRRTDQPIDMPLSLNVHTGKSGESVVDIGFTDQLDAEAAKQLDRYEVRMWDLKRSQNYGSDHLNEHELEIASARVLADGKTLQLTLPDLEPTWGMSIALKLKCQDGREVERLIHNTVHKIAK